MANACGRIPSLSDVCPHPQPLVPGLGRGQNLGHQSKYQDCCPPSSSHGRFLQTSGDLLPLSPQGAGLHSAREKTSRPFLPGSWPCLYPELVAVYNYLVY